KKSEEIHDKIQIAKELWKTLFEVSMEFIDPDKQGYDDLFKYFDEFVKFEELIFASDSFYRDHTLHCLWVYFLGEYLNKTPEFEYLFRNVNRHLKVSAFINEYYRALEVPEIFGNLTTLLGRVAAILENEDSVRCVIALTHDLGYPLKKIAKINKSIRKVLPYFSISKFGEFDFHFENVQQFYIENLLEILSINISFNIEMIDFTFEERQTVQDLIERMNSFTSHLFNLQEPSEEEFLELRKLLEQATEKQADIMQRVYSIKGAIEKDMSAILRYSNDFEHYTHGIMSAYLLMKTLKTFSNLPITYSNPENIGLDSLDIAAVNSKMIILKAMTDHTSQGYQIRDLTNHSEILVLFDELEEFSRISRANQYRQFINEFCKTDIGVKDGVLNIDFIFDDENVIGLDPEITFKDKCKRFTTVFDIRNLAEHIKIRFRSIGKLPNNTNVYELFIERNNVEIKINGEEIELTSYLKTKEI
ncbi:MAG: hypothetical protein GOP50_12710, partial [Candidatus Heimdallarchaeota archaeon]|nr:hypothetical protein [Candidatus Heimdallarchaeota archaeon]